MKRKNGFRAFVLGFACCSLLMVFSASAFAADVFPNKPIRFIIPWPAGGAQDIAGRLVVQGLSERLGQQVIVENRGGDGGTIGFEVMTRSAPDGYTISIISDSHAFKPAFGEKLPFDPVKSFAPIGQLGRGWNVLAVHPSVPANNVKEFIALLKEKPGQLICAASGNASVSHMNSEMFKMKTGTDYKILQFQGGGPSLIDLLGGHSNFGFISLSAARTNAESGKLRLLAVMGSARSPLLPGVPIISEDNGPDVKVDNWWGLVAPTGTPQPIIDRISQALKETLDDPKTKETFLKAGCEAYYSGPQEVGERVVREIASWTEVVKAAGIKMGQ
ncbi:MAG: tripartite tricarboxylate transporter substrate binding protein [Syntrophaceae bacterium]|nr:tripartite tricarboxylate transporter substrate binding protein [Syntrophaceae bacterium]